MSSIRESCSVCQSQFDVQFRYQMEERDGGFSFFCSQACLDRSHGKDDGGMENCDACGRRFRVELVSHIVYVSRQRHYACSMECRSQLAREANGVRLGEIARSALGETAAPPPAAPNEPAIAAPTDAPAVVASAVAVAPRAPLRPGPRRIAVFNHKGGTGKTTTSVSLAAGLALRGMRVLIVDTDSQGNVGVSLDVKSSRSLYHVLVMGTPVEDAVVNVRPNLDVLPANETLAAAELYLAGRQNRDRVLATRLAKVADRYDIVVVDCSPSLSLMNQNALVFADSLLIPVACDYLSLVGVRQVIKTVKNVNQLLHHPVQIWGVLPTFYDMRARICRDAVDTMQQHFGERCLTPIRAAIKVKEAPAQGQTIFEYAPGSTSAEDYMKLVDRVVAGDATDEARASA